MKAGRSTSAAAAVEPCRVFVALEGDKDWCACDKDSGNLRLDQLNNGVDFAKSQRRSCTVKLSEGLLLLLQLLVVPLCSRLAERE